MRGGSRRDAQQSDLRLRSRQGTSVRIMTAAGRCRRPLGADARSARTSPPGPRQGTPPAIPRGSGKAQRSARVGYCTHHKILHEAGTSAKQSATAAKLRFPEPPHARVHRPRRDPPTARPLPSPPCPPSPLSELAADSMASPDCPCSALRPACAPMPSRPLTPDSAPTCRPGLVSGAPVRSLFIYLSITLSLSPSLASSLSHALSLSFSFSPSLFRSRSLSLSLPLSLSLSVSSAQLLLTVTDETVARAVHAHRVVFVTPGNGCNGV